MKICIKPLEKVNESVLESLKDTLSMLGDARILNQGSISLNAYNPVRRQYNSTTILQSLGNECDIILGITEVDLYTSNLNFVFGEAELGGKRAVISLRRLMPEFYGIPPNEELLKLRALKESMHEIGHVLGLLHCQNHHCVMHFSNSIFDTDLKSWKYCKKCKMKLEKLKPLPSQS
jgi:archaemetzincin